MAVSETALVTSDPGELDKLKTQLLNRLCMGKTYWQPHKVRQDYWMQSYRLLDVIQQMKPLGIARRFISNEPQTGVNAALSIMTRNPTTWRIPLVNSEDENAEERRVIGKIERTLEAFGYDLDELFSMRGQMPLWKQIHFQGLTRGCIVGKFQVTTEALKYRESPLIAEIYDSRLVYPNFDSWGLNHVLIEKGTNLGDLVASYPDQYAEEVNKADFNPNTPVTKVEYWSNDRGERKGINACLAIVGPPNTVGSYTQPIPESEHGPNIKWVIPPYYHDYTPTELPIIVQMVNGAHLQHTPILHSVLEQRLTERADITAMHAISWQGPGGWVSEMGRSILASIEEQIPQYNELIATIFQHLSIGTYGTWIFKNPMGELPEFEPGIESKVALTPQESVERIEPSPITPDAYRLVEILREEREKGVLAGILQAANVPPGSGVLWQQVANAALNSLEPFQTGGSSFGTRFATSILGQLQKSGSGIGKFNLEAATPKKSFFRIEFDPKRDLDKSRHYRPQPVMKPALPDDIISRMTAARTALDPRAPMLSLITVMETILQIDDPMAELDRIWEDLAQRDPVLLPEIMAQAFDRLDEPELAKRMRETEFMAAMAEEIRMRQLTGTLGALGMQQQGQPPLPPSQAGPLSANTARTGTENNFPPGGEGLGVTGERVTV